MQKRELYKEIGKMEKEKKIKNLIHLAIKAGKIKFGEDNFFYLVKKGKVKLILLDKDLSERAIQKIKKLAELNKVRYIFYPGNMGNEIKNGVKLISITDINFARPISEMFL